MLVTLEDKVHPKHAALIVIDMQNDFCHNDGAVAKQGRNVSLHQEMTPRLLNLLTHARREDLAIIFVRQISNEWSQSEVLLERQMRAHPDTNVVPCQEGTWGAEFYQVSPQTGECVVTKHRYSAFVNTDLNLILRSRGIKTLIMTGVVTNACVESTARDGFMRDYYIVFMKDCTAAPLIESHETTLQNIDRLFGVVTTSAEVTAAWPKVVPKVATS